MWGEKARRMSLGWRQALTLAHALALSLSLSLSPNFRLRQAGVLSGLYCSEALSSVTRVGWRTYSCFVSRRPHYYNQIAEGCPALRPSNKKFKVFLYSKSDSAR